MNENIVITVPSSGINSVEGNNSGVTFNSQKQPLTVAGGGLHSTKSNQNASQIGVTQGGTQTGNSTVSQNGKAGVVTKGTAIGQPGPNQVPSNGKHSGFGIRGKDVQPANSGLQPAKKGSQPANSGLQPANSGLQPANSGLQPANSGLQPAKKGLQPAIKGSKPAIKGSKPGEKKNKLPKPKPAEIGRLPQSLVGTSG